MSMMAGLGSGNWRTRRNLIAAILALEILVIGAVVAAEYASRRAEQASMSFKLNPGSVWRDNPAKPVVDPPIVEAARAHIKPGALVIGVEVDGRARAYRLEALEDPSRHLVSDSLGGTPLTVSYCNLSRCVQVYTKPKGAQPLDIEVVGLLNSEMIIKVDGNLYYQASGRPVEPEKNATPMSCGVLTPVVTTWEAWHSLHPESDVYEGAAEHAAE